MQVLLVLWMAPPFAAASPRGNVCQAFEVVDREKTSFVPYVQQTITIARPTRWRHHEEMSVLALDSLDQSACTKGMQQIAVIIFLDKYLMMSPDRRISTASPLLRMVPSLLLLLVMVAYTAPSISTTSSSSRRFVMGFNLVHQQQHPLRLRRRQDRFANARTTLSVHQRQQRHPRILQQLLLSSTTNNHNIHDHHDSTDESSTTSSKSHLFSCDNDDDDDDMMMNRRSALEQINIIGGMALSSLLLSSSTTTANAAATTDDDYHNDDNENNNYDDTKKKRILITGSNSGIGLDAAQRMVVRGHEVVLACVSFFVIVLYLYRGSCAEGKK